MQRHLWAYRNAFGWFAVDPEACEYKEERVDTVEPVLAADTKHALLQQAEEAGYDIGIRFQMPHACSLHVCLCPQTSSA